MISLDHIAVIHEAMAEAVELAKTGDEMASAERWIEAANLALTADEMEDRVSDKGEAIKVLQALEKNLAEENRYLEIAALLFGNVRFDSRPQYVRDVFEAVIKNHKLIILGASSTSKTYSCGVLYYLFWRNDPYFTQVILAGPSEDHLYGNLFSHIVGIHKSAALPVTDDDAKNIDINETDMFISMHDALPEMRIRCVLCKQNQISATGLRGHKPKPVRTTPHPRFGSFSRVYELIDEGTHVSPGAFEDIKTTEACINPATDTVKIVIACNPEGVTYKVVELAEPEGGWDVEQVDTLYNWTSAKGYPVLRLDGKRCENVIQRVVVYEGLITYEAFLDFLKSGEHSGPYWAKGRGFPPLKDNAWTIIPPSWMNSQRGEPIYVGVVKNIGAEDTALGGGDKALWGVGRWGEAAGWRKANGETEWFVNRANPDQRITKYVLVLDQIFQLPKSDNTVTIIQELMGRAKQMEIPPENVAMDAGGNAAGVWSHAQKFWGDVLGIDSGERASEDKVLSDDLMVAYDIYERMVTELWFATRRWLDPVVCAVLINPIVPTSPLFNEMTTRRYRNVKGGKVQVEPKHEWRARMSGVSPDCFIAGTLVLTPSGERPIESLKIGDMVTTPVGNFPVFFVHKRQSMELVRISFSNGRTLTGKPNHPIFTWNRGWVRMSDLRLTDNMDTSSHIYIWQILGLLFSRARNTTSMSDLIATLGGRQKLSRTTIFTGLYGPPSVGRFLKECASTILTEIRSITESAISCSCLFGTTTPITENSGTKHQRPSLRQKEAENSSHQLRGLRREENDPPRYASNHGNTGGQVRTSFVLSAATASNRESPTDQNSVPLNVETRQPKERPGSWRLNARSVMASLLGTSISNQKPVLVNVEWLSIGKNEEVFNLTLTDHNVYYANGILVQNCADVLNLLVAWCRKRGGVTPGIMEEKKPEEGFESVSIKNADEPDTLETNAGWTSNRLAEPE